MATIRRCDRIKSHMIEDGEPVFSVTGITITDEDGNVVFEHPGFKEICQRSFDIMEKHLRTAFRMPKTSTVITDDDDEDTEETTEETELAVSAK